MRTLLTLLTLSLIAILMASFYGVIHDQVTYTICPEYYTRFKFLQFQLANPDNVSILPHPREDVALVGIMATWWFGAFLGICLGVTALICYSNTKERLQRGISAMLLALGIAIIFAICGYFWGRLRLANTGVDWWLPDGLVHKKDFITVGTVHNFSYLGGISGLLIGVAYLVILRKIENKASRSPDNEKTK